MNAADDPHMSKLPLLVFLVAAALTLLLVVAVAPVTLLLVLVDGAPAVLLVAIATLVGTWVVPVLRLGHLPLRWQLLIGAGTGLGVLAGVVLLFGLAGLLDRTLWLIILGGLGVVAIGALFRLRSVVRASARVETRGSGGGGSREAGGAFVWLWLLAVPFAAMTMLVTVVPPGFLWAEEGGGYDVLEYHLELPKEYLHDGRIAYTPHNVYGNFPANVEVLYLLCMILRDDPYAGAATAKILNGLFAVGCVFGVYAAARSYHSDAGSRHSDAGSRHSERTPRHSECGGPCHSPRTPRHSECTPCHSECTPCHSERTPCHSERTPCHSERTPCHSERTPCHSERSEESSRNTLPARFLATLKMTGKTVLKMTGKTVLKMTGKTVLKMTGKTVLKTTGKTVLETTAKTASGLTTSGRHAHVCAGMCPPSVAVVTAVITAGVGWLTYLSGVAYVENGLLMFTIFAAVCVLRPSDPSLSPRQRHTWLAVAGLLAGFACGCKYTAILLTAFPLATVTLLLPARSGTVRWRGVAIFTTTALIAFAPWAVKNIAMTGNPLFPLANTIFHARPAGWGDSETHHFNACHELTSEESSLARRLKTTWQRIPADPLQRFGVALFALAALRLLSRARNRVDMMLLMMFAVQLACWMMFTHLYARFAVPMVVPLVLLAGRAFLSWPSRRGQLALTAIVIAGAAMSTFATGRYYVQHLYHNGEKLPLEGAEQFFLQGMGGGHEHLATINEELPADARILMIGDAKAFYFQREVDYCVVFNRNPFIETVRDADDDDAIIKWLRLRGYTHVLVNWAEVSRLGASRYGFAEEIQPALFDRLTHHGLEHLQTFTTGDPPRAYAVLYRVAHD